MVQIAVRFQYFSYIVDVMDLYQPQSFQVWRNRFGDDILSFVIPPPKFNSEFSPEKCWLEDDLCRWGPGNFSGSMLVFWGVRLLQKQTSMTHDAMPRSETRICFHGSPMPSSRQRSQLVRASKPNYCLNVFLFLPVSL